MRKLSKKRRLDNEQLGAESEKSVQLEVNFEGVKKKKCSNNDSAELSPRMMMGPDLRTLASGEVEESQKESEDRRGHAVTVGDRRGQRRRR